MQTDTQTTRTLISNRNEITKEERLNDLFIKVKASPINLSSLSKEICSTSKKPDEYWYVVGSKLKEISRERLYKVGGYRSFSDYCRYILGYSRQHSYKLIKVVDFIDELWEKAQTREQKEVVERLFFLGFTKLFLLHSLPYGVLRRLIEEGMTISNKEGAFPIRLSIEEATISQIRSTTSGDHTKEDCAKTK